MPGSSPLSRHRGAPTSANFRFLVGSICPPFPSWWREQSFAVDVETESARKRRPVKRVPWIANAPHARMEYVTFMKPVTPALLIVRALLHALKLVSLALNRVCLWNSVGMSPNRYLLVRYMGPAAELEERKCAPGGWVHGAKRPVRNCRLPTLTGVTLN